MPRAGQHSGHVKRPAHVAHPLGIFGANLPSSRARQSRGWVCAGARMRQPFAARRGPLRCSVSWPVAKLAALTAFAMLRTIATSQYTCALTRAAHEPCAPRRRICRCQRTRTTALPAPLCRFVVKHHEALQRGGRCQWGRLVGRRSAASGSARAARVRSSDSRDCSAEANAVSVASFATRPGASIAESACRADRHSRSPYRCRPPRSPHLARKQAHLSSATAD